MTTTPAGMSDLDRAKLAAYQALRAATPHLPDPRKVTPSGVSVNVGGAYELPRVTLTVYITIPTDWEGWPSA